MSSFWICFWLFLIFIEVSSIESRGKDIAKELKRMNDHREGK